MAEKKKKDKEAKTEPENMTPEEAKETADEAPQPEERVPTPEEEKLNADYKELYDKYLRLAAEFDNFKKRTAREKTEIYSAAKTDVVEKLLPVIDNLERAESFSDPEKIGEGLAMIIKQFRDYLEKLGITEIEAKDKPFDPAFHNAVMHEDSGDGPENTVAEVFQKGYMLGEKVLRPAMVKVIN